MAEHDAVTRVRKRSAPVDVFERRAGFLRQSGCRNDFQRRTRRDFLRRQCQTGERKQRDDNERRGVALRHSLF